MRWLGWLFLALLLHGVFGWLSLRRETTALGSSAAPAEASPQELDIDLALNVEDGVGSSLALERSSPISPSSIRVDGAHAAASTEARAEAPAETPATAVVEAEGPEGRAPTWTFTRPPLASLGVGAAGVNPFLGSSAVAEGAAAGSARAPAGDSGANPNKAAENAVRSALRARDLSLGLGPEGPILSALSEVAYATSSPARGVATFTIVVGGDGAVASVQLDGDSAEWSEVLRELKKKLTSQRLALRGARGARLRVELTSDVLLASGSRPNEKLKTPLTRSDAVRPTTTDNSSGTTLLTFDLTDLTPRARRVVHTRLIGATFD